MMISFQNLVEIKIQGAGCTKIFQKAGRSSIGLSVTDAGKVHWFTCALICTRNDDKNG